MKTNPYNLFFQRKNFVLLCLCFTLGIAKAQTNTSFFARHGYTLNYAPTFYDMHIKENVGLGISPTRGYQVALSRYIRPSEHWGVEIGLGAGYHVLDARINFSTKDYPNLPFDLKNGRLRTEDYFFQIPIQFHYYHALSSRLALDYHFGGSAWTYLNGGDFNVYNQGSIGEVTLNWTENVLWHPKLMVGVGAQYQLLPWLATRASLGYDFGLTRSMEGAYQIKTDATAYQTGNFTGRGSAVKTDFSLVMTNNKYVNFKEQSNKWAQRKWDVLLELKTGESFISNGNYNFSIKDSIKVTGSHDYTNSGNTFRATIGVAIDKHWSVFLGMSRMDVFSSNSIEFIKIPHEAPFLDKEYSSYQFWYENQWTLEGAYSVATSKRMFLQSKLGVMLFLHDTNFSTRRSYQPDSHFNKLKSLQSQTYGLNGELGLEYRLIKPLSLLVGLGYVYNFNDAVYQRRATIYEGQTDNYFFTKNFTIRIPTFNLGLKYNVGYFYNGDKSNWLW